MNVTIGQGKSVHIAYTVTNGNVTGSLCNPYAWERSRVRVIDAEATCPRCAKATNRAAELVAQADRRAAAEQAAAAPAPAAAEYTRVNIVDAEHGDEMLQAGKWVPIDSVTLMTSSSNVVVRWIGGGSMSFPRQHNPAVRRAVTPEPAPAVSPYCGNYPDADHTGCPSSVECFHAAAPAGRSNSTDDADWHTINDNVRTVRHNPSAAGGYTSVAACGGAFRGDWDTVTCDRCGLHVNTLDSVTTAELGPREVLLLDGDRLVAVSQ
jgi:hypothetical protein